MWQRLGWGLGLVLLVGAGYGVFTNDTRVVPYRNTAQYWMLRWTGAFDAPDPLERGTLAGVVRSTWGKPIPFATVLLPQLDGTAVSTESDTQGRYTLQAPAGNYVPVAGAPGFEDTTIHTLTGVGIGPAQTTQLDIVLGLRQARPIPPAQNVALSDPQTYGIEQPLRAAAVKREISYTVDGQANQPTFYYTPNDNQNTPLPVLLTVYPGPADEWESVSLPLAQAGYAVIAVGPRYALDLEPDIDDLERVIDMARDGTLPRADGTRIGALGGSYSSLHVFRLAIRNPDLLKAAVLLGPPTDVFDLRRRFEEGSFAPPFGLDQVLVALGLPNNDPERYWRYSARYHARSIQTPLMLIHSKQDELVPFAQSEILAAELQRLGKPHQLLILDGLPHYLQAPEYATEVDELFRATIDFLAQELGDSP